MVPLYPKVVQSIRVVLVKRREILLHQPMNEDVAATHSPEDDTVGGVVEEAVEVPPIWSSDQPAPCSLGRTHHAVVSAPFLIHRLTPRTISQDVSSQDKTDTQQHHLSYTCGSLYQCLHEIGDTLVSLP